VFNPEQPIGLADWPVFMLAASRLQFRPGTALWRYWTRGKGAAKWMSAAHPWTTLRTLLLKYVSPGVAKGLATNIMLATPAGRALFKAHHGGRT
jgi:hypothetical protein